MFNERDLDDSEQHGYLHGYRDGKRSVRRPAWVWWLLIAVLAFELFELCRG